MEFWAAVILMTIGMSVILIVNKILGNNHQKTREHNFVVKEGYNQYELSVLHREKKNKPLFFIRQSKLTTSKYHPTTATLTAVTIGGITTGKVDIEKAHYSLKKTNGGWNTYEIAYMNDDDYSIDKKSRNPVKKLILSAKDAEVAEKHPILRRLLKDNTLVLEHEGDKELGAAANSISRSHGIYEAAEYISAYSASKNLTYDEANAVISFLLGEI